MNKNINLVVNTLIKYDNKDNLSWMMVYKSILKELNLDNMISNSIFLRDVVKRLVEMVMIFMIILLSL